MTREEAIEVYNGLINTKIKEAFEFFAPELKESGDEWFINELQGFLESYGADYFGTHEWQKFHAWLENQKEPIDPFDTKLFQDGVKKGRRLEREDIKKEPQYTKRNALFDKCLANCDPEIRKRVSDEIDSRLKKEQKPAEWSEEDEKRVKQLIYDTEHIRAEYEKRKKELGESFNDELIKDCDEQIDWLKSLRPTKDCSDCAKHLEGYISGRSAAENKLLEQFGALVTPEGELHIKPRWKPSEEQMGSLNYAYCELFKREDVEHNILGPLQNLIDTLRKL